MDLLNHLTIAATDGGLNGLWDTVLGNWIQPIFLAMIAIFAIKFIKDRQWTALVTFIGIAAVVGVLVFGGESLFGSEGSLKGVAEEVAGEVNAIAFHL